MHATGQVPDACTITKFGKRIFFGADAEKPYE